MTMASRRIRTRPDKRTVDFDGPAPDLERAFQVLTTERRPRNDEDSLITLKDGSTVDLAKPWKLPANVRVEGPSRLAGEGPARTSG